MLNLVCNARCAVCCTCALAGSVAMERTNQPLSSAMWSSMQAPVCWSPSAPVTTGMVDWWPSRAAHDRMVWLQDHCCLEH